MGIKYDYIRGRNEKSVKALKLHNNWAVCEGFGVYCVKNFKWAAIQSRTTEVISTLTVCRERMKWTGCGYSGININYKLCPLTVSNGHNTMPCLTLLTSVSQVYCGSWGRATQRWSFWPTRGTWSAQSWRRRRAWRRAGSRTEACLSPPTSRDWTSTSGWCRCVTVKYSFLGLPCRFHVYYIWRKNLLICWIY